MPRTSTSTSIIDLQFISACALNPLSFLRNIDVQAEEGRVSFSVDKRPVADGGRGERHEEGGT